MILPSAVICSNNTNKLSPQEQGVQTHSVEGGSNNTNKLSPQELYEIDFNPLNVQIIQINLVLKNCIHPKFLYALFK